MNAVHAVLQSPLSSPKAVAKNNIVTVLNISPFLMISLTSQSSQPDNLEQNYNTRMEHLLLRHVEQGLAPALLSRAIDTSATLREPIFWHLRCIQDLITAASNEGFDWMKFLLYDPTQFIAYVARDLRCMENPLSRLGTGNSFERSLNLRNARHSLRVVALTLALKLRDKDLGRLIGFECIAMDGRLRSDLKQCIVSSANNIANDFEDFEGSPEGSSLLWIVRTPFSEPDANYRMAAARDFGSVITGNNYNLLYTIFATDEECNIMDQARYDEDFAEEESAGRIERRHVAEKVTSRLFREVDRLIQEQCAISQSHASCTLGYSDNADVSARSREQTSSYRLSTVAALSSLCSSSDVSSPCGVYLFEQAILRLIRLWMCTESHEDPPGDLCSSQESLSAVAFLEISRLSIASHPQQTAAMQTQLSQQFIPNVFCVILRPTPDDGLEIEASSTRTSRCRRLKTFLEAFIIPHSKDDVVASFQHFFQFVNDLLPSVLAHFVIAKDYECLCLTTFFKLFLLREKRRIEKKNHLVEIGRPLQGQEQIFANPAVKVTVLELEEQLKLLCLTSGVIERILPSVFMRSDRDVLLFLTHDVLKDKLTLKEIVNSREKLILKDLIWEVGRDPDCVNHALRALRTAAIARTQESQLTRSASRVDGDDACPVSQWITPHFMYLLVNVVQYKWKTRTHLERLRALRCLRQILAFLLPAESAQYFPQVMATVNAATASEGNDKVEHVVVARTRLVAVQALFRYIELLVEKQWMAVGANLTAVVVALNPVLTESATNPNSSSEGKWCLREARRLAVQLLERLSHGAVGKRLSPYFRDIPFLLMSPELENVRLSLQANGVDFDGLVPIGSEDETIRDHCLQRANSGSMESGTCGDMPVVIQKHAALHCRLNMLFPLLTNENVSIRKAALQHLTDLVRTNRDVFHSIVENESRMSVLRFLTENYAVDNPGPIEGT